MTRSEAGFHSSAEQYRHRSRLAMDAYSFEADEEKRGKLLDEAREYERLASMLEEMRVRGGPDGSPRSALMKRLTHRS